MWMGACRWDSEAFFSESLLSNFLSNDLISHIVMNGWDWGIYLVCSLLLYYSLCFVRIGMEARRQANGYLKRWKHGIEVWE